MILKDYESKARILKVFKDLYEHVSVSLGPNGHTALIRQDDGKHIITKDGVTIVKHYKGEGDFENTFVDIIRQTAQRTDLVVGDGTTSTIVFSYHLFEKLFKLVNSGNTYVGLIEGVDEAIVHAEKFLSKYKVDITSSEQIGDIAYVSSNNDTEVANIVKKAVEDVGNSGTIITTRNRRSPQTVLEIREGFSFDEGYISPEFINNPVSRTVEYDEPHILVTDYPIRTVAEIWPTLQLIGTDKRPLIIIAETVEGEALASIVTNAIKGLIDICCIRAPYYGEEKANFYQDICDLTGATFISRTTRKGLHDVAIRDFGKCAKFDCKRNMTTMTNGAGDMNKIKEKVNMLREKQMEANTAEEAEELTARINRLSSGVAEIQIGGYTEAEMKEKKYRYDDALGAVQAAYKSGTVVGGGITYINLAKCLIEALPAHCSNEYRLGYMSVVDALYEPFYRLIASANLAGHEQIILNNIEKAQEENTFEYGYNMLTRQYCDLRKDRIIEPTMVIKNVLKNSHSIVKLLLNSEAVIL